MTSKLKSKKKVNHDGSILVEVNVESYYSGRECPENSFYTNAPIERIKELIEEIDYSSRRLIEFLRVEGFIVWENSFYRDEVGMGSDVDSVTISSRT